MANALEYGNEVSNLHEEFVVRRVTEVAKNLERFQSAGVEPALPVSFTSQATATNWLTVENAASQQIELVAAIVT